VIYVLAMRRLSKIKRSATTLCDDRSSPRILALTILFSCFSLLAGCETATIAENNLREKNTAALELAAKNIEQYRKGPVRIKVLDVGGKPAANAGIEIKQVSHSFKFGCYLKIDDLDPERLPVYSERFKGLFNYAVIGTYWSNIEKKEGSADWSWFDREAALSKKLGSDLAAAPVLWGTNKYGRPKWLPTKKDDLLPILERHVRSTVSRNTAVSDFEVVNEPLSRNHDVFAETEYIPAAFKWAKGAAPSKRLMINESGIFGTGDRSHNSVKYLDLLRSLITNGVPIDIIGIQAHAQGDWYEPADVAERLAQYVALGKPIQITEFSVQTHEFDDRTVPLAIRSRSRKGQWTADSQAAFYREFYTIAFGNPQVEAIVTWGLDDERAWLPGIGLIDKDGEPKPAYRELDRLINQEWQTRLNGRTDSSGSFDLRGFFGDYEVTTTQMGRTKKMRFKLLPGKTSEWIVQVDD
jgi:GH35 family endo-1,4-beta-xylanase